MEQHLGEQTYGDNAFSKYICCKISQQVLESGRNSAICIFFLGGGWVSMPFFDGKFVQGLWWLPRRLRDETVPKRPRIGTSRNGW
jgi:hypothetical protein